MEADNCSDAQVRQQPLNTNMHSAEFCASNLIPGHRDCHIPSKICVLKSAYISENHTCMDVLVCFRWNRASKTRAAQCLGTFKQQLAQKLMTALKTPTMQNTLLL